uniref:Neurotensin/neuromedin N n=1 Tax=Saimiri boliviensis boliviensis TaxID=39432 RepID=A0A2K6ULN8_SAIBB
MMAGMKIQLVCFLLLAFSSCSLCSDSEEEMKALEADLLTNMRTSKLIQEDILETGNDKIEKEEVIKRKIPYILKRQLYENKPRRPYILKRDSYYY